MALLPTGVNVVTATGPKGPAGATANAVCSLSIEPMLMLACLDRGSRTLLAVQAANRFGIGVLSADQEEIARAFATKAPVADKWSGVAWSERDGIPAIDDTLVWVACELRDVVAAGDHVIVTGEVSALEARRGRSPPLLRRRVPAAGLSSAIIARWSGSSKNRAGSPRTCSTSSSPGWRGSASASPESRVLEVRGRKSGEWRRTPVNLLEFEGDRYLVAPRGNTQWVRNLRVTGSGRLAIGRRVEEFTASELPDEKRPPLLRAYLKRWKWEVGAFFDGVGPDAPEEELRRIASEHPVFRISA